MSETSHTSRALPALFSEFGGFGFRLSCSDPVPDRFQVSNPLGSFRGLSRGVCLASLYTLYTPRPAFLPPQAWSSQRLLYTVVQVHQIPLHILTVYLFPNAVVGSHKYMLNCEVISWAVQVADSVQAPVLITGDFNLSWRAFDLLRDMVGRGWNDLHELANQRFDSPLSPTCKGATRHSFQFANSELSRFLTGMQVSHSEDLDSHAVLIGSFDLPVFNPAVWRWSLPRPFDDCELNQAALSLAEVPPQACNAIDQALESDDVTTAFREWSKCAEHAIYMSAAVDGQCPGKKYLGRSSRPAPIKRQLAAPRFKSGRPTDFRVQEPSVALRVRQVQKQARRLQTMERLMCKALHPCSAGIIGEVHHVWRSVVSSPGFGRSFAGWVVTQAHLTWADCPSISQVVAMKTAVMKHAQSCAAYAWNRKKLLFNEQVEKSWTTQGGALPFRLVKEPRKPPVTDLTIQIPVRLAPQRWNPVGKSWFKVLNPPDFPDQCKLSGLDVPCKVVGRADNAIQVDRMLSRREAATLYREFVSADPAVWSDHFLEQWGQFWNRGTVDQDSINQVVAALPRIPMMDFPPLTLEDWKQSLRSAKRRTMRGADGWSVQELLWLPDHITMCLLRIFHHVETCGKWPDQLSTWVLVLLRKTDDPCPAWSAVRPITIAGVTYRLWSRVRTAQFMRHARSIAKPLVAPCLSTRAIWTFLGDLISRKVAAKFPLAGLVLDIVKAFNILDRGLLRAVMVRLGFNVVVVDAWLAMLRHMLRTVLLDGTVHGSAPSVVGIPEGDPLSVIGMFCFAKAFDHYLQASCHSVLCITYADNWEVVARSARELLSVLPVVEQFLDLCQLLVAPGKCWLWAICGKGRQVLRQARLFHQTVPIKLQARELGADISYCLRKAAKKRNVRAVSGLKRMARLHGLPGSTAKKTRVLVSGILPHALHAAESSLAPKTLLQRLRSGAANAIGCRSKGASPWLSCLLATYRCVDPEFVLLVNRLQLFRQVIKELPDLSDFFLDNLSLRSSRPGPSRLLVQALSQNGWVFVGDGIFSDVEGRIFHVCLTPPDHVVALLLSTWSDRVASQVRHRKYLFELPNVSVALSRPGRQLLAFERKLILQQQIGAFFSGEYTKNIDADAAVCRHCGQPDSRLHRLKDCPFSANWRAMFPSLLACWDALPEYMTAFGLAPEPEGWRAWQAQLDTLHLPDIARSGDDNIQVFYTDGACLHPRDTTVRIAAGAVLKATSGGSFDIVWSGILPGSCQSIFRAELLAVSCAFFRSTSPLVFTDSKSVARTAQRILRDLRLGRSPCLPSDHRDLWAFFLTAARGTNLDNAQVHWIKGHVDYRKATGLARLHAWYNHWADLAAKRALKGHFTPLYKAVVQDFQRLSKLIRSLHQFQAGVGLLFANDQDAPIVRQAVVLTTVQLIGLPCSPTVPEEISPTVCHQGFATSLLNWIREIRWAPSGFVEGLGPLQDTSWIELFWGFVHDTSLPPPFLYYHDWVWVQDDPTLEFALPSFVTLFRTWKRTLDAILRSGVVVPWTTYLTKVKSVRIFGARFDCPGFNGRVCLSIPALQDLSTQFAFSPRGSSLRVPAFN